jgi:hypothetical protein
VFIRYRGGKVLAYTRNSFAKILTKPFLEYVPDLYLTDSNFGLLGLTSLESSIPDLYMLQRWRRLAILNYFLTNTDSDYLIFTSSSSYLNYPQLMIELRSKTVGTVAGRINMFDSEQDFLSGSFMILDRTTAELILSNKHLMPGEPLDDIAFGILFRRLRIPLEAFSSRDITSSMHLSEINSGELSGVSHFRLKSLKGRSRVDSLLMGQLHARLTKF